jgi:hypothetical protein
MDSVQLEKLLGFRLEIGLLQIRIAREDEGLDLWQTIESVLGETQMIFYNLLRRQT